MLICEVANLMLASHQVEVSTAVELCWGFCAV
eukprot:CAMPEP_0171135200 /NCGR_PEP_ID=MMETSP0766_2-20121228/129402_1 /TAXON_ID=439317 /ORGANISM="Gambierdiscus australes, Strain CAWD 149" /LENGTH=31 /DNA_ID= /DNA_START= /DNA_END= /DNA_ORIENTATION=